MLEKKKDVEAIGFDRVDSPFMSNHCCDSGEFLHRLKRPYPFSFHPASIKRPGTRETLPNALLL